MAPVVVALVVLAPAAVTVHRDLDLLALDDDTPRVLGVRLARVRNLVLLGAVALTATAVSAVAWSGSSGWWHRTSHERSSAVATGGSCPPPP